MQGSIQRVRESLETHGVLGAAILCLRLPFAPILRSDFGVRLNRAYHGWLFDRRFGVDTSGWIRQPTPSVEGGKAELGRPYDGSNPTHFHRIVEGLEIRYEDYAFVDFGSGKGRVLLLASAFPFRSVTGVEWSQELDEIAQRNIGTYKGPRACNEVMSFRVDAAKFLIPSGKSVFYFFNPFGNEVMARVLDNISRSYEEDPREIILVYMNPRHRGLFDRADFLMTVVDKGWFVVYKTASLRQIPRSVAGVGAGGEVAAVRVPS
jgi:SAM-dependent methyltransferase